MMHLGMRQTRRWLILLCALTKTADRVTVQAIGRLLHTADGRAHIRGCVCGICGGQSNCERGFAPSPSSSPVSVTAPVFYIC